jgi:hypothetical protein
MSELIPLLVFLVGLLVGLLLRPRDGKRPEARMVESARTDPLVLSAMQTVASQLSRIAYALENRGEEGALAKHHAQQHAMRLSRALNHVDEIESVP